MTLRDVVEKRYQGFISVEDVIQQIADRYECSESDARHVLARALQESVTQPEIYHRGKLGPEVEEFEHVEILKKLKNAELDKTEELGFGIPF